MKESKLQTMIKNDSIPMFICFDIDKKETVQIWEESPDRCQYRTEIDGEWIDIADNHLIRYRFPDQGFWLSATQKTFIYRRTEEMMRGCKTKSAKASGEYIIEKHFPIKEWMELQKDLSK